MPAAVPPDPVSPDTIPAGSAAPPPWHALSVAQVLALLALDPRRGLSPGEVATRRARFGANAIVGKAPRAAWRKFLDQFRNALVIVLLCAAVLAALLGDISDALVIACVIVLNATLGFYQEHRAEAALAALKDMLAPQARVRRNGVGAMIAAVDLVPGDVLLLEAGDHIPADARVLAAHSAEVAEAALTGESLAVVKTARASAHDAPLAARQAMVFMNTVLVRGRMEAVVCATGMESEMGRIARLIASVPDAATPLQKQLGALGKRLALIAAVVVSLIFAAGVLRGDDLLRTAMTAIALAVAAIPEGLPAVVTVTLALGMQRMARRNAIVKKLDSVETLGCTTVICSDKTGTLTLNQMSARRVFCLGRDFHVHGSDGDATGTISADDGGALPSWTPLLAAAALCVDAHLRDGELIGDPTEGALLALTAHAGIDAMAMRADAPRIAEIPFDSTHKFMATFHARGEQVQIWLKGAPDVLLARCTRWQDGDVECALDETTRAVQLARNAAYAGEALRVIALAGRCIPAAQFHAQGDLFHWVHDLTFCALVGLIDSPRPEAAAAIRQCQRAGIAVKMITGDHRLTAAAIAGDLGLLTGTASEVHEGSELDALDAGELAHLVERTAVFARVSPTHKLRIVEALKAQGHVVAMTGDGVNDAPALKTADIGVAMGITGTAVSREAASLVLADDNFASIVHAVEEGRTIYDNIVKFVRFQLSTNIGAMFAVLGAPLLGMPMPFTAIQILWVNLIMDGPPAMTLGVEPPRPGLMNEAPRSPGAAILGTGRLARLCLYGLSMAVGTLAVFVWGERQGGHAYAVTLAFTTFVLFQFFNIFNARAEFGSAFNRHFFSNARLWLALVSMLVLQMLVVHWAPAQAIFETVALHPRDWALAAAVASSVLLLDEARKLLSRLLARRA